MKKVGDLLGAPGGKYDCSVHYGRTIHHNDLVGVEIEYEHGDLFDFEDDETLFEYWNIHEDGSLRNEGRELVFRRPLGGASAEAALAALGDRLRSCTFSYRTSVHVHLDVRDITSPALYRLILTYIVLEELLFDVCGRRRANNNFCLASYKANGMLEQLGRIDPARCVRSILGMDTVGVRYAAMNLDSVRKFGSLEFRGHEGTGDTARIAEWINILTHMKHYAVRTRHIEDLITKASEDGPRLILHECFPEQLVARLTAAGDSESRLLSGARRAQDVLLARQLSGVDAAVLASTGHYANVPTRDPAARVVVGRRDAIEWATLAGRVTREAT